MGNYDAATFIEIFGGLPEPGEAIPDLDAIRDRARYPEPCPICAGTGGGTYNDCPACDGNGVV